MLKKILLGVSLLLLVACGEGKTKSEVIKLQGSDTILNTSQAIAEEFMKENKEARIAVTGGGSGTGIAAKLNGTVHVAMASRSIKDKEVKKAKEVGIDLEEIVLGFDGITVIINHDNKITDLDKATLGKVFAGEVTNWNELGGEDAEIVVLSRDSSSGTHSYFKEEIVRNGKKESDKEYGPKTLYMPSNQAILQEVKSNKYAIGYIGMGYMEDSVNALSVNGIEPTFKNVADKNYPIAREVYWYVDGDRKGDEAKLVDFALSPKGQAIVKSEGFVPAR
ncbi:phosphate ABC transporter substrate-binding protein [Fusobacteria bacterium ZRK30]|nr:phosphate ABC transporter substrate-binding protein [Fusobacteria bacterium ZRK30]